MAQSFTFNFGDGVTLNIKPPTLRMYYKQLLTAKNDTQLFNAIANICNRNYDDIEVTEEYVIDNFTTEDLKRFMKELPAWVNAERQADPNS